MRPSLANCQFTLTGGFSPVLQPGAHGMGDPMPMARRLFRFVNIQLLNIANFTNFARNGG
jgi:hypothetical protein